MRFVVLLALLSCGGTDCRIVDVCNGATGIASFTGPNGPFAICACEGPSGYMLLGYSLPEGEDACSPLRHCAEDAAGWRDVVVKAGGSCGAFKTGDVLYGTKAVCN